MRHFRPSQLATAVALALAAGGALAQYSGAYVFGDSLSDAGQYGSRFTTNPGLTAAMYVTQQFGISVTPSFTGGTDYAQGGARVNAPSPLVPPGVPDFSIVQQVSLQLGKGPLDSNALYQIQGGANDIFVLSGQFAAGAITQAQLQAGVSQAAVDLAAQVGRLRAGGANYIVLYTVPDIGKTPFAASQGAQASFSALSGLFNATLNGAIAGQQPQVLVFDTFKLLNEILQSPAQYGFVNTTIPVCTTASSLQCTPATLRDPNGAITWVFADGVHPTTGANQIVQGAVGSMLQAPAQIATLGSAPLPVEAANFRAIDARFQAGTLAPGSSGKLNAWVNYDYANPDFAGSGFSGDAKLNTITLGGDVRASDTILVGGALGFTQNKSDFGGIGTNGSFKLNETTGTFYAGMGSGPWWAGLTLAGGSLDYDDIRRNITLGPTVRTEQGGTKGWTFIGRILGGYWFQADKLVHGPFAKYTYQQIKVDAYSEQGSTSTGLQYADQNVYSNQFSLGWQATGQWGNFRPFGRATWEYDSSANGRSVTATPIGGVTSYTVPGYQPDDNWVLFSAGASADFGKITGYLYGSASAAKSDGNYWAITVGIRAPL